MENWRAGLIGVGIVLIGLGGYSSLEGVWKGLSLVAAGIALVLLGLSLERKPREAPETGEIATDIANDHVDVTAPMAAVVVEDAEATVPLGTLEPASDGEAATEPEPALVPEDVAEPEPASIEDVEMVPAADAEPSAPEEAVDETAHRHDQPMLGHSELVSHIRDYHEGVPFDGSTIQLRLLHERAHP